MTMCLVDDPDESYDCPPAACRRCGAGLAGEPVTASRRHQVTDIGPPPEPKVTQYVAQAKECPCGRMVTEGEVPARARARASYGPEACAQAANLTCGHHIPVNRATVLLGPLRSPNGASPNSTPSATCSTATPGNHPDLNPPDNRQRPAHVTSRR